MSSACLAQTEAQFAILNIAVGDTKYYHGFHPGLRYCYTSCVAFWTTSYGEIYRYQTFLTGAYELSECERVYALLNLQALGNSTPSELIEYMISLLGGHTPCFLPSPIHAATIRLFAPGLYRSGLPHLQSIIITNTNHCHLVVTGAHVSFIPASYIDR